MSRLSVASTLVPSGHNGLVYVAFLTVPLTAWILMQTRFGLRLRATGENPAAVDTAGISVTRIRYQAVIVADFFVVWPGPICRLLRLLDLFKT